jgi:hypothetical protein
MRQITFLLPVGVAFTQLSTKPSTALPATPAPSVHRPGSQYLNGATFNAESVFIETGARIDNSTGENVFKKKLDQINPSKGTMNRATGKENPVIPDNN